MHFLNHLEAQRCPWFFSRATSLLALEEFGDRVYRIGTRYLRKNIVKAETLEHRVSITVSCLAQSPKPHALRRPVRQVCLLRVDRLCLIYPRLEDAIVQDLSDADLSHSIVDEHAVQRIWAALQELLGAASVSLHT